VECTVESNAGVGSENIYGAEFIFHPRNTRSTVFTVRDVPLEGTHASLLLERLRYLRATNIVGRHARYPAFLGLWKWLHQSRAYRL
jgi:hypothetical protein